MEIKIEYVDINILKPCDYNPRKMTDKQAQDLEKSIDKFGLVDPLVVNKKDGRANQIIGGHMRYFIAKKKGLTLVPVVYLELSEQDEQELNLRLNKNVGEFDFEMLANIDMEMLKRVGFMSKELDKIANNLKEDEDDFDIDKILDEPKCDINLGDIYQLGDHRLICGDATDPETLQRLTQGNKVAMIFTDPPYNVDYKGGMGTFAKNERDGILNDKMSKEDFYKFLYNFLSNVLPACNGGVYICMSSTELDTLKKAFELAGGHFQSFIIWAKDHFTLSRADWQSQYEPILYGWPGNIVNHYFVGWRNEGNVWEKLDKIKPTYYQNVTTIKIGDYILELDGEVTGRIIDKKNQTDVWHEKKPTHSKEHPTMKPIKLVGKAIKASSERGQVVLDVFGGSGSTLIAAEQLDRVCYMAELDPKYCEVIIKRWENLTGKKSVKVSV